MKIPRIVNAVGNIDDDLIVAATESKKQTKHNLWLKWSSIAACFAVLVIVGMAIFPWLSNKNAVPNGTNDRYKDYSAQVNEFGILWPWKFEPIYAKYRVLTIDGIEYGGRGRAVSENLIGKRIGKHTVVGYDDVTSEKHKSEFEVYRLKHADKRQFVAVKMDGIYYVFKTQKYDPPNTLGELFELVDLPKAIELSKFSDNSDNLNKKYYALNDDDYVWEVLADCENAVFVENDEWTVHDREYLSFTVTSETLGVYKVAMYVTADGYLWTNAFDYQYLFDIGNDAAERIIEYAEKNSIESEFEPYQNSVIGQVVDVTDTYILVDDSILCNNPSDGITYKILLNDLRISRYVYRGIVSIGDTVQISYEGVIGKNNTIDSAVSASSVMITDGDYYIPE